MKDIQGKEFSFDYLRKKRLTLIVNVACQWGFTSTNYEELTKIYQKWSKYGFEILAVPCNQFNNQESGTPA